MSAGIEDVGAALVAPETRRHHAEERRHQRCHAIDHSRVDDLAPARALRFEDAADHTKSEIERAPAKVADKVQRRGGWLPVPAKGVYGTGKCDVVQIVPGGLRERALLAPAGDAAINEARVAREAILGAEAQPFGDSGAEPFDQRVGVFDETQSKRLAVRMFEVDRQAFPATQQQVIPQWPRHSEIARL